MNVDIVCVKHGRLMKIRKNGVCAQENIDEKGKPYKIFSYDRWGCPVEGCENIVLAGHGDPTHRGTADFDKEKRLVEIEYW